MVAAEPTARLVTGVLTVNSALFMPSFVMLMPVSGAVPVLRIVKVCAALLLPTFVVGRLMLETPSVSCVFVGYSTPISGLIPVPVSVRSKGFSSSSLLAMWTAALLAPSAEGVKSTVKVTLLCAAMEAGRALTVKSAAFAPSLVTEMPVRAALPVFFSVKVRLLVPATRVEPKSRLPPSSRFALAGCSSAISGMSTAPE